MFAETSVVTKLYETVISQKFHHFYLYKKLCKNIIRYILYLTFEQLLHAKQVKRNLFFLL